MSYSDDYFDRPSDRRASKAALRDMLKRAVVNTGGVAIDGKVPDDPTQAKPAAAPEAAPAATVRPIVAAAPKAVPAVAVRVAPPKPVPAASLKRLDADPVRYVEPVPFNGERKRVQSAPPKLRMADPTVLKIEAAYQRDISAKSQRLIHHIIENWDWAKFKPPVCAHTEAGLYIIDGQHTAIAAASHPDIREIPILIVEAAEVERRAEAFVAHNRDRVAMTPAQIFHGEVAAGISVAAGALAAIERAGGSVPRLPISVRDAKPGQVTAVEEIRTIFSKHGPDVLERIVRIAVNSKLPAGMCVVRAIREVVTGESYAALSKMPDTKIAGALASIDNFVIAAAIRAAGTGKGRGWGGAQLLAERLRAPR